MPRSPKFAPILIATLALAACGNSGDDMAAKAANSVDPAVTSALEDQILVDPNLVQQANSAAVRPAEAPIQAQYPPGADPRVRQASATSGDLPATAARCGADFAYGPEWAERLPSEFPAYPGGRVTEAAGNDSGGCRMRVVTFRTGDPHGRVIDWYHQVVTRAGYSAERQQRGADHVLGGVHPRTDAAYFLIVTPIEGGSDVALIVNSGR